MNEREWLAAEHPYGMIYHRSCRDDRKRRLLVCACARRVLSFAPSSLAFGDAIAVAERYADGLATAADLRAARRAVKKASAPLDGSLTEWAAHAARALFSTLEGAFMAYKMTIEYAQAAEAARRRPQWAEAHLREALAQCALARDVFVNPFRVPPSITPAVHAWNDGLVVKLATAIYEEQALPAGTLDAMRLGVLADALEEAGVTDPLVLGHLREPGAVHVRGCWVVDLLLDEGVT